MPATEAAPHGARRLHLRRGDAARALPRRSPARRTRARAPTRRSRWSPTGARSACSRSASPGRSPSTPTSAGCSNALAAQTAIAIARAQLYEREHTVVPDAAGVAAAARAAGRSRGWTSPGGWRPGAKGVEVGGDFYDAFAIVRGVWGVAIGDVCGKGVDAAALTALARHTVRAAAHAHDSPAAVLRGAQPRGPGREPAGAVPDRDLRAPDTARRRRVPAARPRAAGTRRRWSSTRRAQPRELGCTGTLLGRGRRPADRRHRRRARARRHAAALHRRADRGERAASTR